MLDARWSRPGGVATQFAVLVLVVGFLIPSDLLAHQPPSKVVKALEEEINLLKETIQTTNNRISKLRERIARLESAGEIHDDAVKELRGRLLAINTLRKQLREMEAKLASVTADKKRDEGAKVRINAEVRVRPELGINLNDANDAVDDDDAFWGHRVRLGVGLGLDTWAKAHVQIQEVRTFGDVSRSRGEVSVHQGYIELTPPLLKDFWIRGGRMEMSFGSERLVGRDDFGATGQAFDGAMAGWSYGKYIDIKAFYSKLRESRIQGGDADFLGVYLTTRAVPKTQIELYFMGLFDERVTSQQAGQELIEQTFESQIYTVGGRAEALLFGSLKIEGEAVFQFGKRTDPNDATRDLTHFATAYFAELSYQAPITTRPTLSAFFVWASGDANPGDAKSLDFQPLFPTRHSFLGTMDLWKWQNIMDIGGKLELTPPANFGVFAAFHYFMLAQTRGALPGFGSSKTPGAEAERSLGMEVDVAMSWAPTSTFQLQGGYSLFLPGPGLKDFSLGDDLVHWAYLQARMNY